MDYLFIILGAICILVGIVGSILPGLPGPPLSYLGILLIHWTRFAQFSGKFLVTWAIIVLIVAVLDYVVPVWGTKKYGGTTAGVRGSTIGLIIGVILLPMLGIVLGPFGIFGILGGPFIGAWIGERSAGQDQKRALRAAFGSFVGFLAGTIMKIAVSMVLAFYYFKVVIQAVF
ncbi:MAG TPA: DUF456 domain-containing protein [Bacteroidales bacterium]|jgi:hypothetical protein|nr:DUF456 domain-containing protein [Bacteroidales bacterium]